MRYFFLLGLLPFFFACRTQSPSFNEKVEQKAIHDVMDQWHQAAAEADEETFFNLMHSRGIYLGTDSSERWNTQKMSDWAAPHFEGEKAWEFHPHHRNIYFSSNGKTAWLEESLKTWMGHCRGSAVLTKQNSKWRIRHYHLDKTIPNEMMDTVLTVIGNSD